MHLQHTDDLASSGSPSPVDASAPSQHSDKARLSLCSPLDVMLMSASVWTGCIDAMQLDVMHESHTVAMVELAEVFKTYA